MEWNQNSTKAFPKWKMSPARKMFSTVARDLQYCLMPGSLLLCGQAWANQSCGIRLGDFTKWAWLGANKASPYLHKNLLQAKLAFTWHMMGSEVPPAELWEQINLLAGSSPLTPGLMAAHFWFCCPAAAQVHVPAASSETSDTSHTLRWGHGKMSSYFQFGSLAVLVSLGTGNCPHKLSHCARIHN